MAEYIESICRSCFHSYVCEQFNEHRDSKNQKCHFFNDHFVPAAEVEPVKHGRWVDGTCSECHFDAMCAPYSDVQIYTDYCPNCGSRMDGE